jgi:putative flippase GtrA
LLSLRRASSRLRELRRFFKAQASSGIATAVDWALMASLIALGVHYLWAVVCGAVVGAITDFAVKKWWVFEAKKGKIPVEALRYALVSAISAGLNCLLAFGLVDGLRAPKTPGVIAASLVVGFVWNYPMHRLYVFSVKKR